MKAVSIFCKTRDAEGNENGNTEAQGTTEDEGVTCVIGLGYLSMLTNPNFQVGDAKVTVHQPAVEIENVAVVSVTPDEENGIQTIVFALPE